jgi:hypothetical protein
MCPKWEDKSSPQTAQQTSILTVILGIGVGSPFQIVRVNAKQYSDTFANPAADGSEFCPQSRYRCITLVGAVSHSLSRFVRLVTHVAQFLKAAQAVANQLSELLAVIIAERAVRQMIHVDWTVIQEIPYDGIRRETEYTVCSFFEWLDWLIHGIASL